ncbi:hypothetical protein BJ973_000902 [Actinoplanes tereljensis]|uniref:hypothetical protein n=1 Tax=Paractinoplanes tereljensis TaxID=571912 RepID=UPI0019428248|nr:hypothetical protein [Actinoplanes tereljensis]
MATRSWDSREALDQESATTAVAPSRVQLMLQFGGNQAVGRLLNDGYPHAGAINSAFGQSVPLRSVVDPQGCAEAGVPAFTEAGVTHFAEPKPDLHVAAHEAAHVMQHSGRTSDAGLGAEGHAGAVADAVAAGRSAGELLGAGGERVPAERHNYTLTNGDAKYQGVNPGGLFAKLADTGEAWSYRPHQLYATPQLINEAAAKLSGQKSGVKLSPDGSDQRTVDAPDKTGRKSLSLMKVEIANGGGGEKQTLPSDCRRAALEVMGLAQNPAASVQFDGPKSLVKPTDPRNTIAETMFVQKRINETPDYATLTAADQRIVIDKAKTDFAELSAEEKEKLKHSPLANAAAAKLGLDESAMPGVGEAYSIHRAGAAPANEFEYHYAAVILAPGQDRVTLENSGGDKGDRSAQWKMEMYGPASKQQSFHEEWARVFGKDAHTVVDRDEALRGSAVDYPKMATSALLALYRDAKDPDEVGAMETELRKRTIQISVTVDALEDYTNDEVFVRLRSGDKKLDTDILLFSKGDTRAFPALSFDKLLPLGDKVTVELFEFDLIGNDLIGTIAWSLPLLDQVDVPKAAGDARYRISLSTPPR